MTESMRKDVVIHVDGACKGNPGRGGWGVLLQFGKVEKELFGGEDNVTNNQMELMAAIQGLNALNRPCNVTIYSDSQYVVKGMTEWMDGWKKKNWKDVKNTELWKELDNVANNSGHNVKWQWVRGHQGNIGNERADELANRGVMSVSY